MQREVDWFKGKPLESRMTYYQASAALSLGAPPISRTFWKCPCNRPKERTEGTGGLHDKRPGVP